MKHTMYKPLTALMLMLIVSGKEAQSQNSVTLKTKFRDQETVQYYLRVNANNPEYVATIQARIIEQTRRLLPNGAATIHSELKDIKAQLGEFDLDLHRYKTAFRSWDWVCTARGRVRDTTVELGFPEMQGNQPEVLKLKRRLQVSYRPQMNAALQLFRPLLPDKPIQVGDTYQAEFGGQTKAQDPAPVMQIMVVGIETKEGRTLCRLKMTADVPSDKGKARYEAVGFVDSRTGRYSRLIGTLTGGQFGKTSVYLSLTELPDINRVPSKRTL